MSVVGNNYNEHFADAQRCAGSERQFDAIHHRSRQFDCSVGYRLDSRFAIKRPAILLRFKSAAKRQTNRSTWTRGDRDRGRLRIGDGGERHIRYTGIQ